MAFEIENVGIFNKRMELHKHTLCANSKAAVRQQKPNPILLDLVEKGR